MRKGDEFRTGEGEDADFILVNRVALDESWADIRVTQLTGATWTKRQPLIDGEFAFEHRRIHGA